MMERPMSENRGAVVMDESEQKPEAPPEVGVAPETEADAVLQESAKLAEITRERRRQAKTEPTRRPCSSCRTCR